MKGFIKDIEKFAVANQDFRQVLCTLYAPPNHRDGVVHNARVDVDADNEALAGGTTETA